MSEVKRVDPLACFEELAKEWSNAGEDAGIYKREAADTISALLPTAPSEAGLRQALEKIKDKAIDVGGHPPDHDRDSVAFYEIETIASEALANADDATRPAEEKGELHTSAEWAMRHREIIILDPDGWDRRPDFWHESWNVQLINEAEFMRRVNLSTIEYRSTFAPDATECVWKEVWDGGEWETSCGEAFCFTDGGPHENKTRFCCYCGNPIRAVKYEYTDDDAHGASDGKGERG